MYPVSSNLFFEIDTELFVSIILKIERKVQNE